jgi:exopolysaccharide production protein ExoQ
VLFIKYYPELGRAYRQVELSTWVPVYTGVTTDKNMLGMVCLVFGIGSAWCFLEAFRGEKGTRRTGPLIAHGMVLTMVVWLFWQANSMTSLACFVLAIALLVATSFPALARRPTAIHLLVVVTLSAAYSVLFLDVGAILLGVMGRDPTLTGRTELWDRVLGLTTNPFFGTGFESFWLGKRLERLWSIYWWHPNEAHNGYLEVFLNLGWTGAALFAILLVTGYRKVVTSFRRDPAIGRLSLAYFVAAVAYNFSEAAIKALHPVWIAFLLAIFASSAAEVTGAAGKSPAFNPIEEETSSSN